MESLFWKICLGPHALVIPFLCFGTSSILLGCFSFSLDSPHTPTIIFFTPVYEVYVYVYAYAYFRCIMKLDS